MLRLLMSYIKRVVRAITLLPRNSARCDNGSLPGRLTDLHDTAMKPLGGKREQHVCMIVYTKYMNDARVRREAETLAALSEYHVEVLALKENKEPETYLKNNVKVHELNIAKYRGKSNGSYLLSYLKFAILSFMVCNQLLMDEAIDIVHVHNMPDFIIFSAILPFCAGKKVILDIHDVMYETYLSKFKIKPGSIISFLLRLEERISCAFAHKIICTNKAQMDVLTKRGVPADKITISMNVPDPHLFNDRIARKQQINALCKYKLVYHGTLANRLGIDIAIRAIASLILTIPGIELNIVGDGDDKQELMELTRELGIWDYVHFRDTIPLEDLESVLVEMDMGVVSNRKNCATELMLPVKMLEYIKLGIPVVVPRLRSIQDYFSEDMVNYFNPGDVCSLSETILSTYLNENMRKEKCEKAKRFFSEYDWQIHKRNLVGLYESIS